MRVSAECEAARDGRVRAFRDARRGAPSRRTVKLAARAAAGPRWTSSSTSPELWWPNGYGEQPLYDLTVTLGGHAVSKKIGLRTLQLVNRDDKTGLSMIFRVERRGCLLQGGQLDPARRPARSASRARGWSTSLPAPRGAQHEHAARLGRRAVRERGLLLAVRREGPPGLARHDVLLRAVPGHPGVPRQRGAGDPPPGEAAARPSLHRAVVREQRGRGRAHLVSRVAEEPRPLHRGLRPAQRGGDRQGGGRVRPHPHVLAQLTLRRPRRLLRQLARRRARGHALLERLARGQALQRLLRRDAPVLLRVRLPVLPLGAHHPHLRDGGGLQRHLSRHGAPPAASPAATRPSRRCSRAISACRRGSRTSST